MIRKNNLRQRAILICGDLITLNLGLFFAATIKFSNGIEYHDSNYPQLFIAFNIIWILLIWISKGYDILRTENIPARIWKVLGLLVLHGLVISAIWVFFKAYYYSREFLLITYVFLSFTFVIWRILYIYILRLFRKYGLNYRNIIVYGYGDISTELVAFLRLHSEYGYKFRGFFDNSYS